MRAAIAILAAVCAILAGLLARDYQADPSNELALLGFLTAACMIGGLACILREIW